jgi:hypothetical protein
MLPAAAFLIPRGLATGIADATFAIGAILTAINIAAATVTCRFIIGSPLHYAVPCHFFNPQGSEAKCNVAHRLRR